LYMGDAKILPLSQLLPYEKGLKKHGDIRSGLKEYQAILKAFLEANRALGNLDLDAFDSLVGENACQIRAVWIATLATRNLVEVGVLKDRIEAVLVRVESLLVPKIIDGLMQTDETLDTIFKRESLEIHLTDQEMFLIQSYLLSEMKVVNDFSNTSDSLFRLESADHRKLKRFGDVTTSFADRLLSRLRGMLAAASVEYIRKNAPACLREMVSDVYMRKQNALPCIPMFWTYKIIEKIALSANIPFIVHVKFLLKDARGFNVIDEGCLFFKSNQNGNYEHTSPTNLDLNVPACVFEGVVTVNEDGLLPTYDQWASSIIEKGLSNVILAGAADHRQYPDPSLDSMITELGDTEYERYKVMAKRAGFSVDNPTTFFIQHVYASRFEKVMRTISQRRDLYKNNTSQRYVHSKAEDFGFTIMSNSGRVLCGEKEYV
jgi:hypothetical protein